MRIRLKTCCLDCRLPRASQPPPGTGCWPSRSRRSPFASALTWRPEKDKKKEQTVVQASAKDGKDKDKGDPKEELQGVFVLKNKKDAVFVPVTTGIAGTTDIEVTSGLQEGDEIVTGSYKTLRTLKNGASVKIDNTPAKKTEES